jgi:hypothetical protein
MFNLLRVFRDILWPESGTIGVHNAAYEADAIDFLGDMKLCDLHELSKWIDDTKQQGPTVVMFYQLLKDMGVEFK